MNKYVKSLLVVVTSTLVVFMLAFTYYNFKLPAEMGFPSGFYIGGGGALNVLILAKTLDITTIYFIVALVAGIIWARRKPDIRQ